MASSSEHGDGKKSTCSGSQASSSQASSRASGVSKLSERASLVNTSNSWVSRPAVVAVGVGPAPEQLHITPMVPMALAGVYVRSGEHNGRPAYRLVDEHGAPRCRPAESAGRPVRDAEFVFSPLGYALWWNAHAEQWILGELAQYMRVEYATAQPTGDVALEAEPGGGPVRLRWLRDRGPAQRAGVPRGSILTRINGEAEEWQRQDLQGYLEKLQTPCVLEFKWGGFPAGSTGVAMLKYDSPYPCSVCAPWRVSVQEGTWTEPERPIQCCARERPPRQLLVSGFRRKPRELNGMYDIFPTLHEGRPCYVGCGTRMSLCWMATHRRWGFFDSYVTKSVFIPGALVEARKALVFAMCYAPHPGAVMAHGGIWETKGSQPKRSVQVTTYGGNIDAGELEEHIMNSLRKALADAEDQSSMRSAKSVEGKHLDTNKIQAAVRGLDLVLVEAEACGIRGPLINRAIAAKRKLAGLLLLECVSTQTEKEDASLASWFETLTSIKAFIHHDHADPMVALEDEDGWTTLHFIARYGHNEYWTYDAAATLHSARADLEALDNKGMGPVLLAIVAEKPDNVRALLKLCCERAGSVLLQREQVDSLLDLQYLELARGGDVMELSNLVLGKEVNLNAQDGRGRGAIHSVALRNQATIIDLMIQEGCHVDLKDNESCTALHLAAQANRSVAVHALIRGKANPMARNVMGSTPFMLAVEEQSLDVLIEFRRIMVRWEEIEEVLGAQTVDDAEDRATFMRERVRRLLSMGFGETTADPLHLKRGSVDKLQIWNQLVVKAPGSNPPRCCILDLRAILVCKELLIPLLELVSEGQLSTEDGVRYKRFVRYLFGSGVSTFCHSQVNKTVQNASEGLGRCFQAAFGECRQLLEMATAEELQLCGLAEGPDHQHPWPVVHHHFAHGELPWLSTNGSRRMLLGTMCALVEVDAFGTIAELCGFVAPEAQRLNSKHHSAAGTETLLEPFWDSAYAQWLAAVARKVDTRLRGFMKERFGAVHHAACPKTITALLDKKERYRECCEAQFGCRPKAPEGAAHPLEAGCILDIARCSIVGEGPEDILETLDAFHELQLQRDGVELVAIRNDFSTAVGMRRYKDIQLSVAVQVPGGPRQIAEVRLVLRDYLELRKHKALLDLWMQGEYAEANAGARKAGGERPPLGYKPMVRFACGPGSSSVFSWQRRAELVAEGTPLRPPGAPAVTTTLERWKELLAPGHESQMRIDRVVKEDVVPMSAEQLRKVLADEKELAVGERESLLLCTDLAWGDSRLFRNPGPGGALLNVRDAIVLLVLDPSGQLALVQETEPCGLPTGRRKASEPLETAAQRVIDNSVPAFLRPHLKALPFHRHDGAWLTLDAAVLAAAEVETDADGATAKAVAEAEANTPKTGHGQYADDQARKAMGEEAKRTSVRAAVAAATAQNVAKVAAEGKMPGATRYFVLRAELSEATTRFALLQAGLGIHV